MKSFVIGMLLVLSLSYCSKPEKAAKDAGTVDINGKWLLKSSYISPGGATEWRDADPSDPQYVKFNVDSTITFSTSHAGSTYKYQLTDADHLQVMTPDGERSYSFKLANDTLEMWNLMCIEGCGFRYVKE